MKVRDIKDFIHYFTHNKGLSNKQLSQRDFLLSRDYVVLSSILEKQGNEISYPGNKIQKDASQGHDSNRIHCPQELVSFLNSFTLKGGTIKYTTHQWDEEENSFESFDVFVEKYQEELKNHPFWKINKDENNSRIFRCSSHLYSQVRNFLLEENPFEKNKFWGNHFYAGYMANNTLKNWMDKNPGKTPFEMPLSEYPAGYIQSIEGKNYVNFEDIVNEFKSLIEFRDTALFHALRNAFSGPGLNVNKEKLNSLKGKSLYTDVAYVKKAFRRIATNIKCRSEQPNVDIWIDDVKEEDGAKKMVLHILHVNSFSDTSLNSDKLQLKGKGDMIDIKESLIGLCDFSVISRFDKDGIKNTYKIDYLYDENPYIEPRIIQLDSKPSGFEYLLYFYL